MTKKKLNIKIINDLKYKSIDELGYEYRTFSNILHKNTTYSYKTISKQK